MPNQIHTEPDMQTRFKDFLIALPVTTRFLFLTCVIVHVLSWLIPNVGTWACLLPATVMQGDIAGSWYRFVVSAYVHVGILHIAFNMMALLPIGSKFERRYGSVRALYFVLVLTVLSGVFGVAVAPLVDAMFGTSNVYSCSMGFSGVLFALMVIQVHQGSAADLERPVRVLGMFSVAAKFYPWALLIIIQFIMPSVSFCGHLGGIIAGYAHVFGSARYRLGDANVRRVQRLFPQSWVESNSFLVVYDDDLHGSGAVLPTVNAAAKSAKSGVSRAVSAVSGAARSKSTTKPFSGKGQKLGGT